MIAFCCSDAPQKISDRGRLRRAHQIGDGLLTALVIESREGGLLVAQPDGLARIDRGPANGAQRRWESGSITAAPPLAWPTRADFDHAQ
jgi:hypothetical protein